MLKFGIDAIQRAACAGITMGADFDCTDPLKASVNERLLVGNLDDIATITLGAAGIIADITMKSTKQMWAFQGNRSSVVPNQALQLEEFITTFIHQVDFSVFDISSMQKINIQAMAATKQFAIYQNPKDSSVVDSVWEVLGPYTGLELTVANRLPASKDGSYKLQLTTPEAASETALPPSFWSTDITTTEALIEALLVPAI